MIKKNTINLFYLILLAFVIISSFFIFNHYIWQDEAFSIALSQKSITDIIHISMNDVHPPLYYIILKYGIYLLNPITNHIVISAKIISFIPYVLLPLMTVKLLYQKYHLEILLLFACLLIGMPHFLSYAIEVRMYSYAYFFVTLTIIYALKVMQENKHSNFIGLGIFAIASLYTHYFAGLACIIIFAILMIYILFKQPQKQKAFWITAFIVSLCFLPWILTFIQSLSGRMAADFWIQKPTLQDIISYVKFPFSMTHIKGISYLLIIFTYSIILIGLFKTKNKSFYFPLSILLLVTFIGVLVSLLIKPIFINRYMLVGLGCFWISIPLIINDFTSQYKKYSIILYIFFSCFIISDRILSEAFYKKQADILETTVSQYQENIITDEMGIQLPLSIYFPNRKIFTINPNEMHYLFDNIDNIDTNKLLDNYILILKDTSILNLDNYEVLGQFYLDNVGNLNIMRKLKQ